MHLNFYFENFYAKSDKYGIVEKSLLKAKSKDIFDKHN